MIGSEVNRWLRYFSGALKNVCLFHKNSAAWRASKDIFTLAIFWVTCSLRLQNSRQFIFLNFSLLSPPSPGWQLGGLEFLSYQCRSKVKLEIFLNSFASFHKYREQHNQLYLPTRCKNCRLAKTAQTRYKTLCSCSITQNIPNRVHERRSRKLGWAINKSPRNPLQWKSWYENEWTKHLQWGKSLREAQTTERQS